MIGSLLLPERGGVCFLLSDPPGAAPALKIGFSARALRRRVEGLQTANPWPLRLVAFLSGASRQIEADHHRRFESLRIRTSGSREWFRFEGALVEYVLDLRRRGCRELFNDWLARQRGRDDVVGDLADDDARKPLPPIQTFSALRSAMSAVTTDGLVREAAMHAWYEYRKGRPSPDVRAQAVELASAVAGADPDACVWTKRGIFRQGELLWRFAS